MRSFIRPLALLAPLVSAAVAQPNVAQCPLSYSWAFSYEGPTPCQLANSLLNSPLCFNSDVSPLAPVASLPEGAHYLNGNADVSPCGCTTIVYGLMSACADCQGRDWLSWTDWTTACAKTWKGYDGLLPFANEFPAWAFIDFSVTGTYDPVQARAFELNQAATAPPLVTSSLPPRSTFTVPNLGGPVTYTKSISSFSFSFADGPVMAGGATMNADTTTQWASILCASGGAVVPGDTSCLRPTPAPGGSGDAGSAAPPTITTASAIVGTATAGAGPSARTSIPGAASSTVLVPNTAAPNNAKAGVTTFSVKVVYAAVLAFMFQLST